MLFKNNNLRPAFATAGNQKPTANRRSFNDAVMYNTDSYSDTSNFGGFNEENTRDRAPAKRTSSAKHGQANKKNNNSIPYWVWIAIAAAVVVILLVGFFISVSVNKNDTITMADNSYISYTEDGQTYYIATNGTVLDTVFESEPKITPSLDRSFAYVECESEEGVLIYLLRDKKLSELTMEGSSVSKVLAYAKLEPGVVYEEEGKYNVYTEKMGEDLITKKEADNFIISDDASTVIYTLPDEEDARILKLCVFQNESSNYIGYKNCLPKAISADGDYIYAEAFNSATNSNKLYCFTTNDGGDTYERDPVIDSYFGGISAINIDGDEIIYYAINENHFTTHIYDAKKKTSYDIGAKSYTPLVPTSFDPNVVRYGTFKNIYVESNFSIAASLIPDFDGISSGHTYYINNKYEAESIAKATGKFSPDGKYFYYINTTGTLWKADLSKPDESDERIYEDVVKFEITQKGNVYYLISDSSDSGMLYYYKASTGKKDPIHKETIDISMHNYANKLYFTTLDEKVLVSEEGSKGESVKFDSEQLVKLPYFSDPNSKKTFACYQNDETMFWSIFYTSNGNSFDLITSDCQDILGSWFKEMLNEIFD